MTAFVRVPGRAALSPTRMICALPASAEPDGFRRASVSLETAGSLPASLSSVGTPSGLAISTEAAIAACQSRPSTIATACGRFVGEVEGNTALTAPATSAAASAPATRVVFLVAETGKPSSVAAERSVDFALICGALPLLVPFSLSPEQPPTASRVRTRGTASGRSTATHDNDRYGGFAATAILSLVDWSVNRIGTRNFGGVSWISA